MKIYALIILLSFTKVVYAGTSTGKVSKVTISYKSNIFYFQLDPATQNNVACATSKRYAVSTITDSGKVIVSGILSAKATQQTVKAVGDEQCTINADSEDVWFIEIN